MIITRSRSASRCATAENQRWVALAHLAGLFSLIGPLVMWSLFRERSDAIERESREALNFQATVIGAALILFTAGSLLSLNPAGFVILALAPVVLLAGPILAIIGAIRANGSGLFRYPLALRLIP